MLTTEIALKKKPGSNLNVHQQTMEKMSWGIIAVKINEIKLHYTVDRVKIIK